MSRFRFACFLFVAAYVALPQPGHGADTDPSQLVEGFHLTLLETMRNADSLGVKGRYRKLEPRIEKAFHLPLMIQVASSSFWKDADEAQRDRLVSAFSRLSVSTYANQFDGYSGQSFEVLGEKPGPQETVLVDTRIVNPSDDDVDLTYVTRKIKGEWRIIDVLLDTGISELAVRRSEYRRILKNRGVEGLIDTLNNKADSLTAG